MSSTSPSWMLVELAASPLTTRSAAHASINPWSLRADVEAWPIIPIAYGKTANAAARPTAHPIAWMTVKTTSFNGIPA